MFIKRYIAGTLVVVTLASNILMAGGYQLNEQGARAVGMGGAFVAQASDPSAIYYNPAGLTMQSGINLLAGGNLIMPVTSFISTKYPTELKAESQVITPMNLYGTYQVNDKVVVGLGIFNPFGRATKWEAPHNIESRLQTWYINPSIGYQVSEQLSLGFGISYVYGMLKLVMPIMGKMTYDASGNNVNVNFGAMYKPVDKLSIGLSYRLKTEIEFSDDVGNLGTVKSKMPMPGNLCVGLAYQVSSILTVEGDLQYVQWSSNKKLELESSTMGKLYSQENDWVDNVALRGGVQYKIDDKTTFRAGVILDLSPQPPSKTNLFIPDADHTDFSVGISQKLEENFNMDIAYMLVLFIERNAKNADPSGVYRSYANIFSINLGYSF